METKLNGSVIIPKLDILNLKSEGFGVETSLRVLMKEKGVPMFGVIFPQQHHDYIYIREDMMNGDIRISWKLKTRKYDNLNEENLLKTIKGIKKPFFKTEDLFTLGVLLFMVIIGAMAGFAYGEKTACPPEKYSLEWGCRK